MTASLNGFRRERPSATKGKSALMEVEKKLCWQPLLVILENITSEHSAVGQKTIVPEKTGNALSPPGTLLWALEKIFSQVGTVVNDVAYNQFK